MTATIHVFPSLPWTDQLPEFGVAGRVGVGVGVTVLVIGVEVDFLSPAQISPEKIVVTQATGCCKITGQVDG